MQTQATEVVLLANVETNILTGENPCNSAPFPNELMKEQDWNYTDNEKKLQLIRHYYY